MPLRKAHFLLFNGQCVCVWVCVHAKITYMYMCVYIKPYVYIPMHTSVIECNNSVNFILQLMIRFKMIFLK